MTIQSFATRVLSCAVVAGSLLLVACDADLTGPEESLVTAGAQSAEARDDSHQGARRVKLCHRTGSGAYTKITMADAALGVHIAHGDGAIGDPVPGMAGYEFDANCRPVEQEEEEAPPSLDPSSITAGANHSCGLDASGAAYCWGYNDRGQLGDGTTTSRSEPVAVDMTGVPAFAMIRAGGSHTVALTVDGQAYAWGSGSFGQLGNGTSSTSARPVAVTMPDGVTFTTIDAGSDHSVAVASTGDAYGWGYNVYGMIGNGLTSNRNVPVVAYMPADVEFTAISAGQSHTVALSSTGAAYAWGSNAMGQLGAPVELRAERPTAVTMPAGATFTSIEVGSYHNVALDADGAAYAWGGNGDGQLGDGSYTSRDAPVPVTMNGETFRAVSAGGSHTAALTTSGEARAWGWNGDGQLGDGSGSSSTVPTAVAAPAATTFSAISAGSGHTLALTDAGTAYGWGYNPFGQVGDGSTTSQITPVAVAGGIIFQ